MQCGVLRSAKIALAFGIFVSLLWRKLESASDIYAQLKNEAKDWPRLTLACLILLCSSPLTFFRWYLALPSPSELPFGSLQESVTRKKSKPGRACSVACDLWRNFGRNFSWTVYRDSSPADDRQL